MRSEAEVKSMLHRFDKVELDPNDALSYEIAAIRETLEWVLSNHDDDASVEAYLPIVR